MDFSDCRRMSDCLCICVVFWAESEYDRRFYETGIRKWRYHTHQSDCIYSHYYIKRIIGLPGETVEIKDGEILINGEKIEEDYKTTKIDDPGIVEEPITLGGDEFFVLGDDRQNSEDSRMADIGNVKRTEIEGKVWFVIAPKDHFGFVK